MKEINILQCVCVCYMADHAVYQYLWYSNLLIINKKSALYLQNQICCRLVETYLWLF